jgi:hypothetical protein
MASLDTAFNDLNLANSKPPQIFNQTLPQFHINYPFWSKNMRTLLMIKQQSAEGDNFMKYSPDTWGLRNAQTGEHEPYYILCDHITKLPTRTGGEICGQCGWFCKKTTDDQAILDKQCKHPREYSIFNTTKQLQRCGQCGKMVKFNCNINNV